jgi:hypothetical protein
MLLLPKYPFALPACHLQVKSGLDKSMACFRRLQDSPSAQTIVIADLEFILSLSKDFTLTGGAIRIGGF